MAKRLIVFVVLCVIGSVAEARYCNSPYCAMCNRIFGPVGTTSGIAGWSAAAPEPKPSFTPTPLEAVETAMEIAQPRKGEVVYDLGCGDGRVLIHAVKRYGVAGLGIEINQATAKLARKRADASGAGKSIRIVEGDATKFHLDDADVIYMYLVPETIEKLHAFDNARVVVSYMHDIPHLSTRKVDETDKEGRTHTFYVWQRGWVITEVRR